MKKEKYSLLLTYVIVTFKKKIIVYENYQKILCVYMELRFRFINYKQVVPYMNTSWDTQMVIDIGSF